MANKNLTTTQKAAAAAAAKTKALPTRTAAPHSLSTKSRGRTTKAAARPNDGRPTTPAGSTTTSSSQKLFSGDKSKALTTVAHAAHSSS